MPLAEMFLEEVEAHLKSSGVSPTEFGRAAVKDPNFVFDLRAGRAPKLSTVDKVREYINGDQPAEATT